MTSADHLRALARNQAAHPVVREHARAAAYPPQRLPARFGQPVAEEAGRRGFFFGVLCGLPIGIGLWFFAILAIFDWITP